MEHYRNSMVMLKHYPTVSGNYLSIKEIKNEIKRLRSSNYPSDRTKLAEYEHLLANSLKYK